MKVALFVRVSTKLQEVDRQISELTAYAHQQGWHIEQVITEKLSGSKTPLADRPGVQQLLGLARRGAIQKVLIMEVSRLGRRTRDLLEIIEELHAHKVSLAVYNYRLETLDARGKVNSMAQFLITLLGDIGRMETETLSERIVSGQQEALRKGKQIGRRAGSVYTTEKLLKANADIVKKLKEGYSIRDVAKLCDTSPTQVQRVKKVMGIPQRNSSTIVQ